MRTVQFNIRVPEKLLSELDVISRMYNVDRNDWIRAAMSEAVSEKAASIRKKMRHNFIYGYCTEEEYKKVLGEKDLAGMKKMKEKLQPSLKYVEFALEKLKSLDSRANVYKELAKFK